MSQQKKVKFIETGLIPYFIGFCGNERSWNRLMKQLAVPDPSPFCEKAGCCSYFKKDNETTIVIAIDKKKLRGQPKYIKAEVAAHEATHAADAIFEFMGETNPSSEFRAYTVGWLTRVCIKELKL